MCVRQSPRHILGGRSWRFQQVAILCFEAGLFDDGPGLLRRDAEEVIVLFTSGISVLDAIIVVHGRGDDAIDQVAGDLDESAPFIEIDSAGAPRFSSR